MQSSGERQREVVIITGSSGMIGSALIRRLSDVYTTVGLDVVEPEGTAPTLFIEMDISEEESVAQAIHRVGEGLDVSIASVIHLAAYYDFSGAPSPRYNEITVDGTERLVRHIKPLDPGQLIFTSTMLVHAPTQPGIPISEEHPLEARWAYPHSKIATENLLRDSHGAMPLAILRLAGVYDDEGHSIPIARQIQRIYEKSLSGHVFPGNLGHGQSYLHLDDLVEAVYRTIERRRKLPEELTLLIGEEETLSYGEIQDEVGRQIHQTDWDTIRIPQPVAKAGAWVQENMPRAGTPFIKPWMIELADDHYELDVGRAGRYLGWRPTRSLRQALPRIVQALLDDPEKWYEENRLEVPEAVAS